MHELPVYSGERPNLSTCLNSFAQPTVQNLELLSGGVSELNIGTIEAVSVSYSVMLTNGGQTVPAADALRILSAIENGEKAVSVEAELYPGSRHRSLVTLVTAHVLAVSPIDIDAELADECPSLSRRAHLRAVP